MYTMLETINGRTRRFRAGAKVSADDLADTVFAIDELLARKKIAAADVADEKAAPQAETIAAAATAKPVRPR